MIRAIGQPENQFCRACFNGKYPVEYDQKVDKLILERRSERADSLITSGDESRLF